MSPLPPPPPPSRPSEADDDLASAYLDGEVTPDERLRVERDPALRARVQAMREVRAVMAQPVAIDAERRERSIATALAALPATVVPLERARSRRRAPGVWLAAAAAVAALLGVVGVLLARDNGNGDEVAVPTSVTDTGDTPGTGSQNPDFPRTSISTQPSGIATVVDLGPYADLAELRDAIAARPEAGAPAPGQVLRDTCRPVGAQVAFTATVGGRAVKAFVAADDDGRLTQVTVVATDSCSTVDEFALT